MTLNAKQSLAFQDFIHGHNVFITGPAGCGKSYLIDNIKTHCRTYNIICGITALTGAAACIIGGQTLHSWGGLGLAEGPVEKIIQKIVPKTPISRRWMDTRVLIIDEISMCSSELFNKLNKIAQGIRHDTRFFGGIQLVLSGDFAQLEPIGTDMMLAFETEIWKKHMVDHTHYLDEIIRQKDPAFQKLLCEIRMGHVSERTKELLRGRLVADESEIDILLENEHQTIRATLLYPHKTSVEEINQRELQKLKDGGAVSQIYLSNDYSRMKNSREERKLTEKDSLNLDKICNALRHLELTVGTQVMLVTNIDFSRGLVNGSRGVVVEFIHNDPVVVFDNGEKCQITSMIFDYDHGHEHVFRKQYPLILAWAMTIHKCQGTTLSHVVADLSNVFCNAQTYVTLSRAKTLEGLGLIGINFKKIKCNPKVQSYYKSLTNQQLTNQQLTNQQLTNQ